MKKVKCPKCKGKGCSHCGGTGYHTAANEGGMMNKKPMNKGMAALKKAAPEVAKKMGYKKGGQAMHRMPDGTMMKGAKHGYMGGGMAKKRMGYKHGGVVEANCGASMKPTQGRGR